MSKLSIPRPYTGKYPSRKVSKRENRVIETAINSIRKGTDVAFEMAPVSVALSGAGAAVTTTGVTGLMNQDGTIFEVRNIGTQTIVAPVWGSTGLDIARDLTNNDGTEITQGCTSRARHAYTVGTDAPVYFEVTTYITDVSGTDQYLIGWRKAEAYQADWNDYDELAAFNVVSGAISVSEILNNAATVTTDTTNAWADTTSKTLRIEVAVNGKVTFFIDGSTPTIAVGHTFDAGEVIVPFLYLVHDTDVAEATLLTSWRCGLIG